MTSARIFVHPRCIGGPASGAMQAALEAGGTDMTNLVIFQHPHPKRYELVKVVEKGQIITTYERMNGEQFKWNGVAQLPHIPEPEVA